MIQSCERVGKGEWVYEERERETESGRERETERGGEGKIGGEKGRERGGFRVRCQRSMEESAE